MVVRIRDVDVPAPVGRHARRVGEFPSRPLAPPGGEEGAARVELLDALRTGLGDVDVPLRVQRDIVRQMEPGNLSILVILVLIVTLWLYGTLMLPGRRSGYVIMILGSTLGLVIPAVHMKGAGVGAALVQSDGGFFFVWTLLALGAGAAFTLVLAARGLWGLRRAPSQ